MFKRYLTLPLALLAFALLSCGSDEMHDHHNHAPPEGLDLVSQAVVDCSERTDTGYVRGNAFPITVVMVDGKPVERDTANAYVVMQEAAAADGVSISIVSGFRTNSEQQRLYDCYINCNCNNCNLAARPGFSNHQSGHALDLNTSAAGVYDWLTANAGRFGFERTVPSERWHWEWWGGGPGGGPCGTCEPSCNGSVITNADCSMGDCAAFGSNCVDDELGARCVFFACPAQGSTTTCLESQIITCEDGQLTEAGDCAAFAAYCSTVGSPDYGWPEGEPRCTSIFCVDDAQSRPYPHTSCFPDGDLLECDGLGLPSLKEPCPGNQQCTVFPEPGCAENVGCPPGDGNIPGSREEFEASIVEICSSETMLGRCVQGAMFEAVDCAEFEQICSTAGGAPRCVSTHCVSGPDDPPSERTVCLPDGALGHCSGDGELSAEDCPEGEACVDGACETTSSDPSTTEYICDDGRDNENDGLVDCDDDDCDSSAACNPDLNNTPGNNGGNNGGNGGENNAGNNGGNNGSDNNANPENNGGGGGNNAGNGGANGEPGGNNGGANAGGNGGDGDNASGATDTPTDRSTVSGTCAVGARSTPTQPIGLLALLAALVVGLRRRV